MKRKSNNKHLDSNFFYYDDNWPISSDGEDNDSESSGDSEEDTDLVEKTLNQSVAEQNVDEPVVLEGNINTDIHWSREPTFREPFEFSGSPGVNASIEENDPLYIFEKYVTNELTILISEETNVYASQCINSEDPEKPNRRSKYWSETCSSEIMLFIGFILLQGIVILPNYGMYFSKRRIVNCSVFSEIFSERRFYLLLKYLHFANNDLYDNYIGPKRLFKIESILQHFRHVFRTNYIVEKNISIDESLMLWKGRLSWKVYIPSKRSRFGIKSYALCESSTGYVWDQFIYIGKETEFEERFRDLAYGEKTILQLIAPLLNKGYVITMDNFFTSLQLFETLYDNKTEAIGTLRSNRLGIPKEIKEAKLKIGESVQLFSHKFMIIKFRESKDVYLLSTMINNNKITVRSKGKDIDKPESIIYYNKTMGGVDLTDNLLTSYNCSRKRVKKYYQKQFRHLVDIACLNSFIVYQKMGGKLIRLDFQMKLIEEIIQKYRTHDENIGRRSRVETPLRLQGNHYPSYVPETEKKSKPYRKCVVHNHLTDVLKKRKDTRIFCKECNVALCAVPCFKIYHTLNDLSKVEDYFGQV